MKDGTINELIMKLEAEMFSWWRQHRDLKSGFAEPYEQSLYDACCQYLAKEKK